MFSIRGQIKPEHPELFALEFGKIAESDFVYTLASTNINPLPDRSILGSSNSATNRDTMSEIRTNEDRII